MSSKAKPGPAVLRRAVARNAKRLWLGTVLAGIYQISAAVVPILIGVIIDRAVETGRVIALVTWIAALVLLFVVQAVSYRFSARNLQRPSPRRATACGSRSPRRSCTRGSPGSTGRPATCSPCPAPTPTTRRTFWTTSPG
ncbi:hypothetical protein [Paractinoplanes toevensis]|uniref:hypothetical protein n=1 Tax=Paractinoplanes toevensis TaxID=571911 RepID=UPI001FE639BC|nr:hypothetical protein [Actinoplanes toevensis]